MRQRVGEANNGPRIGVQAAGRWRQCQWQDVRSERRMMHRRAACEAGRSDRSRKARVIGTKRVFTHGFAAVDVGQADIHDHQIDLSRLGGLHALAAVLRRDSFKLLV